MRFPDDPVERREVMLAGSIRLQYVDEGPREGGPVVMLHGNPTWSYFYRKLVAALRDRWRCVVPDHIGMGGSDKPNDRHYTYTLGRRVDDIEQLLHRLGLERNLTLVLHDWGGMIGMALATRFPDRIQRLVILNTAAFHLPPAKKLPWQLKVCRLPGVGPLLVQSPINAFCRGTAHHGVTHRLPESVRRAYLAPYDSWRHRTAVLRFVQDIPVHHGDGPTGRLVSQVENALGQFHDHPMLICWGLQDFVFDSYFLNQWIKYFPHAQVHRFKDAGHYVLEDAGDEIAPLVRQFLETTQRPR